MAVYEVKSDRLIAELFLQRSRFPGRFAESTHIRNKREEVKATMGSLKPFYWIEDERQKAKKRLSIVKRKAAKTA